ncbi:hypothetical protein PULV_a0975 [Pseudoalteromonas ulvae UL12]|nr:hypothetical protein [Pseudoalteromonas ulvae UL12]
MHTLASLGSKRAQTTVHSAVLFAQHPLSILIQSVLKLAVNRN